MQGVVHWPEGGYVELPDDIKQPGLLRLLCGTSCFGKGPMGPGTLLALPACLPQLVLPQAACVRQEKNWNRLI